MTSAKAAKLAGALVGVTLLAACDSTHLITRIEAAGKSVDTAIGSTVTTTKSTVKAIGERIRPKPYPVALRQRLGDRFAKKMLARVKRSSDKPLERKLNEIATRLADHIEDKSFTYRVYLIEDDRPNAFTPGGGHLFVSSGLVRLLKSEAQMAMVLAHEMAHNSQSHVINGERNRAIARGASQYSHKVFNEDLKLPWLARSVDFLVRTSLNGYTRAQEREADEIGLATMVAAGYDPYEAPVTFTNLLNASKDQPALTNFFFGDHPTNEFRIWRIHNIIKARYAGVDRDWRIRSTTGYDLLARRYWMSPAGISLR